MNLRQNTEVYILVTFVWFCQLDWLSSLVELVTGKSVGQQRCIWLYKVLVPVCRVSNALNFQNGVLKKKPVGDTAWHWGLFQKTSHVCLCWDQQEPTLFKLYNLFHKYTLNSLKYMQFIGLMHCLKLINMRKSSVAGFVSFFKEKHICDTFWALF